MVRYCDRVRRSAARWGLMIALTTTLAGCDIVRNLPLITPRPLINARSGQPITFVATITQNGQPVTASLFVRCQIGLRITPDRTTQLFEVAGVRLAGSVWNCPMPPGLTGAVRANQFVGVQWQVFAPRDGSPPTKVAESEYQESMVDCANPEAALREEQARVLGRYGGVTTVAEITARGFVPSHGFASFKGMGVAFVRATDGPSAVGLTRAGPPTLGDPNLLLFAPSGANVTDVGGADEPYTLIGWAYAKPIQSSRALPLPPDGAPPGPPGNDEPRPVLACIPHHEWMIHAAGDHTPDGGFRVRAPGRGLPSGLPHTAIWDLHIFANRETGLPRLSILNDRPALSPAAGLDAPAGAFFYPTRYDQTVAE